MTDNAWQHLFISALTYFTTGYDNPWTIPDDKLISVVYIQSLTLPFSWQQDKQGLSNWCAGFAAAAIVVITTFFTHDIDFEDLTPCMKFANAMLKKNQFLFSQNRGTDNKAYVHRPLVYGADLVMSPFSGHMSFKMTQLGDVWTAIILKGGQFKFGKAVWSTMTRHYLEPIKELSNKQFGLIIEDTQKFMKVTAPTFHKLHKMTKHVKMQ
ncbi:hypothetical protein EDD16DRAFT_1522531 [Pisolithus croceorrhizus]|nr:hypothetical protein EV401DRAFT_1896368 [Pisolithus croceorrhizus]KAI6109299.1 hypothetical protein EDD16DRAFT_1522531 [Pisolithus croceorrhizus]KAI6167776.1 hypothetical protein EDD17DRAFT_1503992 [Pisolithus thermaeus]